MNRTHKIEQLLAQYEERRKTARQEQQQRISHAHELDPEIARLQQNMASRFALTARRVLANREEAAALTAAMRQDTQKDQALIGDRLQALGLPRDYLDPRYRCSLCQDTGYQGEDRTRFCPCFEKELELARFGSSIRDEHTFEAYNPNIFPSQDQRARTETARRFCQAYGDQFPHTERKNLVLMGRSGLGKTFLLDAVAARVQERGHPALRLTAFQMLEGMRSYHLGDNAQDSLFSRMLSCPLLLIDDLGTEPVFNNVTVEYLFLLLSERENKHTVFATNLSMENLLERYGERICSRLADRRKSRVLLLTGQDLRMEGNV